MDCVFCKIINKEIPSTVVHEDDSIIAFNDIKPSAPVHILVVPKEHIDSIDRLESNHKEIISGMIFAAKKIAREKGLKGYKLVF